MPISDIYELLASEPIPEAVIRALKRKGIPIEPGATFAEALALQMWMNALGGDSNAAKEIRESVEGKAPQRPPGPKGPVEVHVRYANPRESQKP